jgi:acylphosphatase
MYGGPMRIVRRHLLVSGHVQGVSYRDSCRRVAEAHDVTGWIRNLGKGQVEAVFEGEPAAVDAVLDWARHGPDLATVSDLKIREEAPHGLQGFQIR